MLMAPNNLDLWVCGETVVINIWNDTYKEDSEEELEYESSMAPSPMELHHIVAHL